MTQFVNNDVSSGAIVYASDHNTQGALIAAVVNGGIENENIKSGAAISTSKLADDAGITTAKLADGGVTAAKLDSTAIGHGFLEIKRATLGGASDTISITSIPARKYLLVIVNLLNSGAIDALMRFNNDSTASYAWRYSGNGGADTTSASTTGVFANSGSFHLKSIFEITNEQTSEKVVFGRSIAVNAVGAANIPGRAEIGAKWSNTTAQITRIDLVNIGAGDFAAGSEVIVFGKD